MMQERLWKRWQEDGAGEEDDGLGGKISAEVWEYTSRMVCEPERERELREERRRSERGRSCEVDIGKGGRRGMRDKERESES